jgi:hypothetical protein
VTDKIAQVLDRLEAEQVEERVELGPGETSLHFLQRVYRDPHQPMPRRMAAAKEAVSFEHPKLSAVGFVREVDTFAKRLERATLRSDPQGRYYKMIEAQAVEVPDVPAEPAERDPRDD